MEPLTTPKLQAIVLVVLLVGGIALVLASGFLPIAPLWTELGTMAFLLTVPALLLVGVVRLRKRRISAGLVSAVLLSTLLFGILAQVATGASPPERYYLHDTATSGISPAGEYMNATQGSTEATLAFDTVGQSAYWYLDETLPTGSEDKILAAGNYNFTMYFSELPGGWWDSNYTLRQRINISAGSSSIPSSYPVKLTFNHAQLVTDSKSQADGDDIRVVYWTGSAWSEVDRTLGSGSSWNSASTTILFKTQAAIGTAGTIAFDASTNATSGSSPNQWNHPIGGGSNRLLVVACGVEDDTIDSITYNGVTLDGPAVTHSVGVQYGAIWWMNETNLPVAGSYQVSASTVGTPTDINCIATSVTGAAQTVPEATASSDDGETGAGSINTDITTLTDGAWVFDEVGSGNAITLTPDSPQVERGDVTGGSSGAASSTEYVASAGLVNLGWTADSSSNRLVHTLAAWAPAAGAASFDVDHYLYFNHSTAASPPTNTLSARYFLAQSLGETQTSSTTYANKVQLQFTPSETSEHWVVLATWRQRQVGRSGLESLLGEARITVNGAARTGTDLITFRMSGEVWNVNGAYLKINGTTAQQTIGIDFRAKDNTPDAIDNATILAFMIPDPPNADIQYAEDLAKVEDTGTTDAQTVTFTPTSAGDYIWMVNGFHHEYPDSGSSNLFAEDETSADQQTSLESWIDTAAEGFKPLIHFEQRTLGASSQSFIIRHEPSASGSDRQGLTQLLFRSDVFEGVESASSTAYETTTSTSYQTKVSLTTATQTSDRDYVYLVVMGHDDEFGSPTDGHFAEIRLAASQQVETHQEIDRGNYMTLISWGYAETNTGNRALDARYRSEVGSVNTEVQFAQILALRYKEPSLTLEAEESEGGDEPPGPGLNAKFDTFTALSGTGSQSITGVGFQPKALIFWFSDRTATGNGAHARGGMGFSDGTNEGANTAAWNDTSATLVSGLVSNTKAIWLIDGGGTTLMAADLTSLDAGGFTLSWTTAGGSRLVHYLALGGSSLTDVEVGSSTLLAASSPEVVTGLGFQPSSLLTLGKIGDFFDSTAGHATFTFGATASTTSRHSSSGRERSTDNGFSGYRDNEVFAPADDSATPEMEWDLQSFDSDGFTLVRDAGAEDGVIVWMAMSGLEITQGILTQPTSAGEQSITGLAFEPSAVLFDGGDKATTSGYESGPEITLGGATSSTQRGSLWFGETVGGASDTDFQTTKVIRSLTAGIPTLNAEADFVSFNADGFTIDWTTVDATARKVGWVALGPASANVQITAAVHHTKADGTDPQEIVTSATVTIDNTTTNPLVLNIGVGADQTFRTTDPRRLRLLINVTAVTGAGSFVLVYNSAANPTNLETPPVTGVRPLLVNPTLAPTSGTTTTNFNFTIDYRHSSGTPAGVVRVNVSDAANGTYNNFTMSQTEDPDVNYFVQVFQDLTGTTNAFANAQSDSDSGASAVLEQELVITGSDFARPDSDVSNTGGWLPTPLWQELDETTADDTSTMVTSGNSPSTTATFEVGLTNLADPQASTNHDIRFRARGDSGARDNVLTMELYQGTTLIASTGVRDVTTSWTTFTYTLTAGEANSITNYNNLRLRFIPSTSGGGAHSIIDVTWAELEVPVLSPLLLIQFNTTGVRSSGEDTLVIRYNLTSSDDTFGVWVWNFTAPDWVNRGTLDQTAVSFFNYSLTADEKSSGDVWIRFNDTSGSGSTDLSIDYQLVNNTLWKSGVTYYYNTTLAAGEYSHFFWANDTADVSNRTATFAGPSVLAPPFLSNFRLEDLLAASRAGEQLDVDTEYFFLFNVTDESGWGDIGDNGNIALRLWYDGTSGTSVTTLRDATACEAVGNHWTNCLDAFSSNNVYAYANDSGGVASFDSASNSSGSGASLTWSHTTSGSGRLLVVGVSRQPGVTTQTTFSGAVDTTFMVPAGVTSITIKVWGAGGGGGGADAGNGGTGGGGGYSYAVISVTPGETLDIVIGGGGSGGVSTGGGDGGGGGGGGSPVAGGGVGGGATISLGGGGGGGGYAAVIRSGTLLVIGAGGGGGGGGGNTGSEVGGVGGAGGGSTGDGGGQGAALSVATGGTQSGGGTGGNGDTGGDGQDGGQYFGGNGSSIGAPPENGGGGGGSGYWGGGGGGGDDDGAGGGAGGSALGDILVGGSGTAAGNNSDPDYADSAGQGGAAGAATDGNGGAGNPGRIVLTYDVAVTTDNVSFNGVFLTELVNHTETGDNAQVELWYLLDPDTGPHDIVVNQSAANDVIGGATSWTDVDQATPFGTTAVANGTTDTATVDVTSASNEVVVDVVAALDSASLTVGPGQDERWNLALGALDGGGSSEPGAGTVTMNWTLSGATGWAIAGVSLKGSGAGGGPGKNDTAWKDFGFALGSDTINTVELGVEWFRNNTAPILNVTVSWDGGTSWATNQIAFNKSADDDTVEFLDFTAATAWTSAKLNNANLRVRVGTNASGPRLDYVTVRVVSTPSPTTQRDPTACEAVGNNWTNCNDAFSSNNVYAYANGTAGGGDPITFIDRTEQSTSGTSLTVTVPTHLDGDTLITVLVHSDDDPVVAITPPAGWNLVRGKTNLGEVATSPPVLYIYERQASSEPASYDWSWDLSGGLLGVMLSYRGTDAASPIGQNAVNAQTGAGTDAVAPSVTTTTDNELALWIGWSDNGGDGNDPGATLGRGTVRAREETTSGGNGAFLGIGDENIPSPGATGTATWTLQASDERSGVTITLLPAPVAGGAANDTAWKDFGFALGSDTINTVEVGVEWFRNNTAPILNVTVSWDGGTSWATNQTATNKSADDNTLEFLDFTAATAWTPAKLNDANLRVRVGTNASGARLDYVTVRVGSTSELTFSEQTTGANYRIELQYVDTVDPSTASLGEWTVTEGNAVYNASASSLTPIFSGPKLIGYEFKLALKLGFQVRQANDPANSGVGGYNDLNSWNAEIIVSDGVDTTTEQTASTGEHMEFGVYMYTFVNISANWAVTVAAGASGNTNTVTVYYRSNDDYKMTIWFTTHLVKGGDTIDISNVTILAAADSNDNITSDFAFVGLGDANATYIFGSVTWWFTHATDANENTVMVQFSVSIPGASPTGTYVAELTIKIQQRPAG